MHPATSASQPASSKPAADRAAPTRETRSTWRNAPAAAPAAQTSAEYQSSAAMPASLPPRKDPPARRMTRSAATKEEPRAKQQIQRAADKDALDAAARAAQVLASQAVQSNAVAQSHLARSAPPAHAQRAAAAAGARYATSTQAGRMRQQTEQQHMVQPQPMAHPLQVAQHPQRVQQQERIQQQTAPVSNADFNQRYQQTGQMPQVAPKNRQQVQAQAKAQAHLQQQRIMQGSFASQALPSVSHAAVNPEHKGGPHDSAVSAGTLNHGQLYAVSMGLPGGGAQNVQYANPGYANTGFFDQFGMSSSIPLAIQPGQNPATNVVRDLDRQGQGQHAQIQGRGGAQAMQKAGVAPPDMQAYGDQGQQQQQHMMPRQALQGHPQQDLQGHGITQQHMQQQLYQPLDHQNAQPLVMNQNAAFVQQSQVGMHNQAGQLQQATHMGAQETHFDQHSYQNAHPAQLANVNAVGLQQAGDLQSRKGVNVATQTELLGWNSGTAGRVVASGMSQQGGEMSNAIAPGTLINPSGFAPSHIFDMGMGDMRQQGPQNPLALPQHVQGQKIQPAQNVITGVRKMPGQTTDISPRKRRQTNSGAAQPVPAAVAPGGRRFSCSGCGQDFAHKRDRDTHVRTVHERSFSCSKCSARFKTKSDANRHVRIVHDRVRPYPCPSCPSMFSERNKLRRHRETVHEKLRPYACPVCSARFGELGNLRQHTGSLHPDVAVDTAQIRSRAVNTQIQS